MRNTGSQLPSDKQQSVGSSGDVPGSAQLPHGSRRAVDPRSVPTQSHSSAAQPGCPMEGDSLLGEGGKAGGGGCTRGSSSAQVNGAGRSSDAQPQHLLLGVGSGRGRQQQTAPRGKRRTQSCAALPTLAFCGRRGKDSQRRDPEHPSRRGQHPSRSPPRGELEGARIPWRGQGWSTAHPPAGAYRRALAPWGEAPRAAPGVPSGTPRSRSAQGRGQPHGPKFAPKAPEASPRSRYPSCPIQTPTPGGEGRAARDAGGRPVAAAPGVGGDARSRAVM